MKIGVPETGEVEYKEIQNYRLEAVNMVDNMNYTLDMYPFVGNPDIYLKRCYVPEYHQ